MPVILWTPAVEFVWPPAPVRAPVPPPVVAWVPAVHFAWPPPEVQAPVPPAPPQTIDVTLHLKWGRMVARTVRAQYHFGKGSHEEQELESTAYLALCEHAVRFDFGRVPVGGDPDGQFRGWAKMGVRKLCEQEAIRLQNGGTYHTRREWEHKGRPVVVEGLPVERDADGTEVVCVPDRCRNCSDVTGNWNTVEA